MATWNIEELVGHSTLFTQPLKSSWQKFVKKLQTLLPLRKNLLITPIKSLLLELKSWLRAQLMLECFVTQIRSA